MDIPQNYLKKIAARGAGAAGSGSERQEIIERFVEKINAERAGTRFPPVSWEHINGLLAHLKGFDLKWFYRECEKSESFGKYFFGALKEHKSKK